MIHKTMIIIQLFENSGIFLKLLGDELCPMSIVTVIIAHLTPPHIKKNITAKTDKSFLLSKLRVNFCPADLSVLKQTHKKANRLKYTILIIIIHNYLYRNKYQGVN